MQSALVPFEHSVVGTFFAVLDIIQEQELQIVGEYQTVEQHCVAVLAGTTLDKVTELVSHPYVFDQCQTFLATLPDRVKIVQSADTAISAKHIKAGSIATTAVIVSPSCAKMYNLDVLQSVADDQLAVTRYVVVAKKGVVPERHEDPRTSMVVLLKNQSGALAKCAACFAHRDIK